MKSIKTLILGVSLGVLYIIFVVALFLWTR